MPGSRPDPGRSALLAVAVAVGAILVAGLFGAWGEGASPPTPGDAGDVRTADTLSVGVLTHRDTATVFSDRPSRLVDPASGTTVARSQPYEPFHFLVAGGGATAWGPWGELETSARRLRLVPERDEVRAEPTVFIDGRPHRGEVEVVHVQDGTLTVANRVEREAYLVSVVGSELGDEGLAAFEAAKAQAVAARTYAVAMARTGARDSLGVDLTADPEVDQSYPGRLAEREVAARAVREMRDRILTWRGAPALAFYHSTCGGRTERPEEMWTLEARPYLPSIVDAPEGPEDDPDAPDAPGEVGPDEDASHRADYCVTSPHHRWSRSWTAADVRDILAPAASRAAGRTDRRAGTIRSLEVTGRTEHGRVTGLRVVVERTTPAAVDTLRLGVRQIPGAFPSADDEPLPSTWFELVDPPEEGGLAVEGRGSGHGAGMCQWGAVARAERGASWREILGTYYPGTKVERIRDDG